MAKLLLGKEVTSSINEQLQIRTEKLKKQGIIPRLAIVRCGENPSDMAYERGAMNRAGLIGVEVKQIVLPANVKKEELLGVSDEINQDGSVHGCLLLRPLPSHLRDSQDEICNQLLPQKDVDCMTDLSNAGVFMGKKLGFEPCTARACIEILDHYGIDCAGKNAVIIGRSLVIGRPVAMMLMHKNATVTICHTKTKDIAGITANADIIITCAGVLGSLTRDFVRPGQIIVDVSVNWDENKINSKGAKGAMAGDAVFEDVEPIVGAITPVPGGVGAVTTSVLISHVVEAAERSRLQ
jgi:methylenetetrahydrofolate dehydrogenase (NADP+) / methenyltetrahydrofolate cyclohydrolase